MLSEQVEQTRELFRRSGHPFLLRWYDGAVEDYLAFADEDIKVEFIDGELLAHSPATLTHEDFGGFLTMLLRDHVSRNRLGHVWGPNAVMQLGTKRYFSPDLSFLSHANESRIADERVVGPMDLAVEILSKSTRAYDRGEKLRAYREGRVPEVWHIDPDFKTFDAHVLCGDAYDVTSLGEGLFSSTVVAGFSLEVGWLWRRPLPSLTECRAT